MDGEISLQGFIYRDVGRDKEAEIFLKTNRTIVVEIPETQRLNWV